MGALVLFSLLLFSDLLCLRFYPFFHWAMKKKKEKQKKVTLRGQATNLLALIRLFPLFRPFLSIKKKGSPQALNIQIFIVIIFNTGPQRSWFKCALIWYPVMGECGGILWCRYDVVDWEKIAWNQEDQFILRYSAKLSLQFGFYIDYIYTIQNRSLSERLKSYHN